jgi:hypothetical protein
MCEIITFWVDNLTLFVKLIKALLTIQIIISRIKWAGILQLLNLVISLIDLISLHFNLLFHTINNFISLLNYKFLIFQFLLIFLNIILKSNQKNYRN